jgi:N-acetylglutamate synthase-like GNAT family acetyltransferase
MQLADFFHSPDIILRRIKDSDIYATVSMINAAYSYQDSHKKAPRTNDRHLPQKVHDSEFYIAAHDEQIVGCIYIERRDASFHFGLLTVIDNLRGTGIGSKLINAVEAYASEQGAKKVELDYMSVAAWLKTYYERFGYAETGGITHWGTIDLIRMSKSLS